jgi:hypothetical protein
MGGTDETSNLISLTPREHYIAHMILWKAYGGPMTRAFWYMTNSTNKGRMLSSINSKQYENLRKDWLILRRNQITSIESRNRVSESLKEHYKNHPETKDKLRAAMKNRDKSLIDQIASKNRGQLRSEEFRKRLSEVRTGMTFSESHRLNLSESHKGIKASEEAKKKISEFQSIRIRNPEDYVKAVETRKKNGSYCHSEESKKKMSEAKKNISKETRELMSRKAKEYAKKIKDLKETLEKMYTFL